MTRVTVEAENVRREALLREINAMLNFTEAKIRRAGRSRNFGPRTTSRRRESHSTRPGHRRSVRRATAARDDPGDSDEPGDAGPQRRRVVVDDHLVVAVVA